MMSHDRMERTDAQLVERALAGDDAALSALFERHLKPLYAFVRRFLGDDAEAEDVAQDAMVKAWRSLATFDVARNFRTWLFRIARNAAIDRVRKRKPSVSLDDDEDGVALADALADPAPLPPELIDRAGLRGILAEALDGLSADARSLVYLRHNDHMTFEEIAEVMKEPMNTVKSRYRRALLKLRVLLLHRQDLQ